MWRRHALTAALVLAAHLIKVLSCGEARGTGGAGGAGSASRARRYVGLYTGPYFDPAAPNNVTAQLGTHAYLPCKVRQLSNKSVSWIRRRDAHILTVDRFTFIADERFQAFLVEATDTWTLQVKYVQPRDAGLYECQVGTEPKMSHFVQLNVVVPKIEIAGESEIYVKAGSTVSLKCIITQALEEPAYIFWYHNDQRVLSYRRGLRDIRVERVGPDTTVGHLVLHHPVREDSGNYSCAPSNLDSASVVLHVLSGEQPAAMQHGNAARPAAPNAVLLTLGALTALWGMSRGPRVPSRGDPGRGVAVLLAPFIPLIRLLAFVVSTLILCHDEDDSQ
ncbi:hemicentin-2-like [Pieris brassicae]|uniref:hemicentin-2-like n=1 Tax=Pieris brassicae TaxID=7116 RepID=UPI001E65F23F|nr:hemicentin-2-like [Pieris brassicae]